MNNRFPIGQKINLSGHFNEPVILEAIRIQNPTQKLDHVKQEVVTARFFEIPANAIAQMAERS